MVPTVNADEVAVAAFARARVREARLVAAVSIPIAVTIVVIDYRLMLLSFVAIAPLLVAIVEAVRAREVVRGGHIRIEARSFGLSISTASEHVTVPREQIAAVRVTPDAMVIAHAMSPTRIRLWTIPGDRASTTPLASDLERLGARVSFERGLVAVLIGVLVGVLVYRGLLVVGTALVLGALVNIVLALTGRPGSVPLGLALLGGALAVMVIAALVKGLLESGTNRV